MTAAIGNVNRALHNGVTRLVSSFLTDAGLPAEPKPYVPRGLKISDAIDADMHHGVGGDVRGLDVFLNVTARQAFKPWTDLDNARTGADVAGKPLAAFVQWRSGRPVGDSIVVLSLTDFAQLVGGTPPAP